jgi:hypothetical protein
MTGKMLMGIHDLSSRERDMARQRTLIRLAIRGICSGPRPCPAALEYSIGTGNKLFLVALQARCLPGIFWLPNLMQKVRRRTELAWPQGSRSCGVRRDAVLLHPVY